MRNDRFLFAMSIVLLIGGCSNDGAVRPPEQDVTPASVAPLLALSDDKLMPGIDTAALRVLLERVPPEAGPIIRASFTRNSEWFVRPAAVSEDTGLGSMFDAVTASYAFPANTANATSTPRPADIWAAPVTLVLSDDAGGAAGVTIQRRAGLGDFIIMRPAVASAARLSETLRALARIRSSEGMAAQQDRTIDLVVRSDMVKPLPEPRSWTAYLDRKLTELREATPRHIPEIGVGRAIEVRLLRR